MSADAEQSAMADDPLEGDLEVDAQEAEQVKGGARLVCPACHHSHFQGDPPCIRGCAHGAGGGTGNQGFY